MPKKKEVVRLQHKAFGECVLKTSFFTSSSGSRYFNVLCPDGKTRQLLVDPITQYWQSPADEVTAAFNKLSAKALLAEKEKRAAERKRDIYAAKKLATDKRVRALSDIESEIEEVEITNGTERDDQRTDELEYTAASDF